MITSGHAPGVVAVPDQLTIETRIAVKEAAVRLLNDGDGDLVIDLSETRAIDSTGLGLLMTIQREAEARNRNVRIVGLSDNLRALFRLTRLEEDFGFYPTLDAALS